MLYFEWKEEDALKYAKEEGFEDGYEVGVAQERVDLIRKFSKKLSPEDIAETLHVTKEYVQCLFHARNAKIPITVGASFGRPNL